MSARCVLLVATCHLLMGDLAILADEVTLGDQKSRVLAIRGKPMGTFTVGSQEILLYPDGEVTIEQGVVVSQSAAPNAAEADDIDPGAAHKRRSGGDAKDTYAALMSCLHTRIADGPTGERSAIAKAVDACVKVVSVETDRFGREIEAGQGAGFFISDMGHIVTCFHVLAGADKIRVLTQAGVELAFQHVVGFSSSADFAILKVAGNRYPYLLPSALEDVERGDGVVVVGHPHSHGWVLSRGEIAGWSEERNRLNVQFTASISPGSSGGPVVLTNGHYCAMASFLEVNSLEYKGEALVRDLSEVFKFGVPADAIVHWIEGGSDQHLQLSALRDRYSDMEWLDTLETVYPLVDRLLDEYVLEVNRTHVTRVQSAVEISLGDRSPTPDVASVTLADGVSPPLEDMERIVFLVDAACREPKYRVSDRRIGSAIQNLRTAVGRVRASERSLVEANRKDVERARAALVQAGVHAGEARRSMHAGLAALVDAARTLRIHVPVFKWNEQKLQDVVALLSDYKNGRGAVVDVAIPDQPER